MKNSLVIVVLGIVFGCGWPSAHAAVGNTVPAKSLLTVVLSLLLVVALILLLGYIVKRMNLNITGGRDIKVVSSLALGNKERVVVIDVQGQQHLLGVTSHQVSYLASLPQPLQSDSDSVTTENVAQPEQPISFQTLLTGYKKSKDRKS